MSKSKKKWIGIIGGIVAILLVIMIVLNVGMYSNKEYMDGFFGVGEATVIGDGKGLEANYIEYETETQEEAYALAQKVTQRTAEEGIVLLRNDTLSNGKKALPLNAASDKLAILGYYTWHNNMSGGEDPATTAGAVSLGVGMSDKFATAGDIDTAYASASGDFADPASALAEANIDGVTAAIVTIKRNSGEGNDQQMTTSESSRTGLTLNNAEFALIDYACDNFDNVIIVINAANTMELGFLDPDDPNYDGSGNYTDPYTGTSYNFSNIKAALWAGCVGSQGGIALANILAGDVNPSGHTPDIYARDLTHDPTYANFGSFKYTNSIDLNSYQDATYFVEYEEGIYIDYFYHETAAYEAEAGNYDNFKYADSANEKASYVETNYTGATDAYDYDYEVVYPFGYGLSYTTFEYSYAETPSYSEETQTYTFKVDITNTGDYDGKGVAQIYVSVPWEEGQVEKAHVQLVGFAKSGMLEPDETETVTITVPRDYFTSYDYVTEKAYVLDAGDYDFYLASDEYGSHSWAEVDALGATEKADRLWTQTIGTKIVFDEDGAGKRSTDLKVATNVEDEELNWKFKDYDDATHTTGDGYATNFTRADFAASYPTAPAGDDFVMTNEYALEQVAVYNVWDDENQYIDEMPETNLDETSYTLSDMRGVDFDDPMWDDYINQFTVEEMAYLFSNGGWQEVAIESNGVPLTVDADSPYGYYAGGIGLQNSTNVNRWYCGAPMLAATFNTALAREVGEAFGEEARYIKSNYGDKVTGLYGFGMNQHRSAFGGRNYEYYSADPILCGKMGAAEAGGASERGLITFMKHYTLNDQETNRQANGYCAYVNEQAFREVYLRAWEIYMKEATRTVRYYELNEETGEFEMKSKQMSGATGIMTCYNRIGARFGGASDSINGILRAEWGFTGTVLTDSGGEPNTYMTTDLALRQGQNLTLSNNGTNGLYDQESPTAVYWLKNSTRYLLFNKANSNAVEGLAPGVRVSYGMSPWQKGLIAGWIVFGVIALAGVAVIALIATDKIKIKDKFKSKKSGGDEY